MTLTLDVSLILYHDCMSFPSLRAGLSISQINTDLLPMETGVTISFALASSLLADGDKETAEGAGSWREGIEGNLADDWDYVMYGKVCV